MSRMCVVLVATARYMLLTALTCLGFCCAPGAIVSLSPFPFADGTQTTPRNGTIGCALGRHLDLGIDESLEKMHKELIGAK